MANGGQILIVDGNHGARTYVRHALERAGYETREAATGHEALEAAREQLPLLALVEVRLPDMAGYELHLELREEHGQTFPIFFVSGDRTEAIDRIGGLFLGADDFITVPFDPDELVARVRRSTEGLSGRRYNRPQRRELPLTPREQEVLALLADGIPQSKLPRICRSA